MKSVAICDGRLHATLKRGETEGARSVVVRACDSACKSAKNPNLEGLINIFLGIDRDKKEQKVRPVQGVIGVPRAPADLFSEEEEDF